MVGAVAPCFCIGELCLCVAAFHVVRHIEQKLVRANVAFMITAGLNALMIPFGLAFMITAGLNVIMMLFDTSPIKIVWRSLGEAKV